MTSAVRGIFAVLNSPSPPKLASKQATKDELNIDQMEVSMF